MLFFLITIACSSSSQHNNQFNLEITDLFNKKPTLLLPQYDETINVYDSDVILIRGRINKQTEHMVRSRIDRTKYVILDTTGGLLDYAYNISLMISQHDITTIIPIDGKCRSACTVVFQAGKKRYISTSGHLLYHPARWGGKYWKQFMNECPLGPNVDNLCLERIDDRTQTIRNQTDRMFEILEARGLSPEIYQKLKELPNRDDWFERGNLTRYGDLWIYPEDALKYDAATEIIDYLIIIESPN